MQTIKVDERLSVAGQPQLADFARLAEEGISKLVNVRPDAEEAGQPGTAAERRAAEGAGIGYGFIPVTGQTITEADIRAFQAPRDPWWRIARAARVRWRCMHWAKFSTAA